MGYLEAPLGVGERRRIETIFSSSFMPIYFLKKFVVVNSVLPTAEGAERFDQRWAVLEISGFGQRNPVIFWAFSFGFIKTHISIADRGFFDKDSMSKGMA